MLRQIVNLDHVVKTEFENCPALGQVAWGERIPDYLGSALYYMEEQGYDINHLRRCLEFGLGRLKQRGKKDRYYYKSSRREGAEVAARFGYMGSISEWRENLNRVISDLRKNKEMRFNSQYWQRDLIIPAVE